MIILIDNYDSFTWNLYHFLGDLWQKVKVFRNDKVGIDKLIGLKPKAFVISPGPGEPTSAGISVDLVRRCVDSKIPLLGVCLGHQAIAYALNGKIIRAQKIFHGKICEIITDEKGIFTDIPKNFNATRYHSLVIEEKSLPNDLYVSARTEEGTIMGVRHKNNIIEGIQFHPESIATEYGHKMLSNFLGLIKWVILIIL